MRDEQVRKERVWRGALHGVLGLVLLSAVGFAVWFTRPPRVEVEFSVHASDGSAQEVRLGGRPVGTTPLVLSLDRLRAASVPVEDPGYRDLLSGSRVGSWRWSREFGSGSRAVMELGSPGPGEPVWLVLELSRTARDEDLRVPIECGPPDDGLELAPGSISWTRSMTGVRLSRHLEFRVP